MPQQCHLFPSSSRIVRGIYICICPYLFILPLFSVYTQSFSVVLLSCKFIKPNKIFLNPMASLTKFLRIVDFLKECSPWQDSIITSWKWRSNKKTAYFVRLRQVFQVIVTSLTLVGICWFILSVLLALLFHFEYITSMGVTHNSYHLRYYFLSFLCFINTYFFRCLLFLCFIWKYCPSLAVRIACWFVLLKLSDPQTGFTAVQYLILMQTWQQIPRMIFENLSFAIIIDFYCSFSLLCSFMFFLEPTLDNVCACY